MLSRFSGTRLKSFQGFTPTLCRHARYFSPQKMHAPESASLKSKVKAAIPKHPHFPGLSFVNELDKDNHPMFAEETKVKLPKGAYGVKDTYLWDNWAFEDNNGTMFRYALFSRAHTKDGTLVSTNDRHGRAAVRVATRQPDTGEWKDRGVALQAKAGRAWPNQVVWTGCVAQPNDDDTYRMIFTGRSRADEEISPVFQRLGIAFSDDGLKYVAEKKPILDPRAKQNDSDKFTYDITGLDNVCMCWRDPSLFFDEATNEWRMFFAAKAIDHDNDGKSHPAVGVARPQLGDNSWKEPWELMEPIFLPRHRRRVRQLEVPNVVMHKGFYYLFVSTQFEPEGKTNEAKEAALRCYVSSTLTAEDWHKVDFSNKHAHDLLYGSKIYATKLCKTREGKLYASAFYSEGTHHALTCAPLVEVEWTDGVEHDIPSINYDTVRHATN